MEGLGEGILALICITALILAIAGPISCTEVQNQRSKEQKIFVRDFRPECDDAIRGVYWPAPDYARFVCTQSGWVEFDEPKNFKAEAQLQ